MKITITLGTELTTRLEKLNAIGYNLFELYQLKNNKEALEMINDNPTPNNPKSGTRINKLKKLNTTEKAKLIVKYFDFLRYLGPISITSFTMSKPKE